MKVIVVKDHAMVLGLPANAIALRTTANLKQLGVVLLLFRTDCSSVPKKSPNETEMFRPANPYISMDVTPRNDYNSCQ